jgi:hypothetical protein
MKPEKQFNRVFTAAEIAAYVSLAGAKVWKNHKESTRLEPKPFKSGLKVNTVKGIEMHPVTGYPAFTFVEDSSHVECFRCSPAPKGRYAEHM